MSTPSLASLRTLARRLRKPPGPVLVIAVIVALVAGGTAIALLHRASPADPARRQTAAAPPGPGPVNRPLPAGTNANHGYANGKRPPVIPPGLKPAAAPRHLTAQEWAAVPKPAGMVTAAGTKGNAKALDPPSTSNTGAVNLILRSGFDFNDTSLVLYFDAADPGISGWQSWIATVFDPDTGAAQDSRPMQPSDAAVCQVPAQFCHSFGAADGWSLVGGHEYFATITVTFKDSTEAMSPASALAAARTTSDPPALPNQQVGCACTDALFPTTGGQVVRGSGVNTGTGSFTMAWNDLQLPGFGVTFDVTRRYSSGNTTAGSMGVGWSWTYDIKVIPPAAGQTSVTVRAEDGAAAVFTAGDNGAYNRPPGVRSNLFATATGWRLVAPVQTVYTFDSAGRLTSVLDPRGHGITLSYSATAITMTDASGRTITGTLTNGLLTKIALPDARSVAYAYTNGLLTAATDASGAKWTFGYTNQQLTTVVDPQQRTQLTNTYAGSRITKQVDAAGAATIFTFDPGTQISKTTDADGVPYFDGYHGNVLVFSQNGNGDTVNQRYDQEVDPNLLVDPQGNQTASTFDPASNMLSMTAPDPFNFQIANSFDGHNNLTTHTDGLGHVARFGYTAFDEIASILAPAGDNTVLTYDDRGLITKMTDPRGKVTTLAYDAAGNLTSQTTPLGELRTYTYDSSGRVLTAVDPRGNLAGNRPLDFTTSYTYDNLDRVTAVLAPRKAHPSTTSYDNLGQLTRTTDPLGHQRSYAYAAVIGRTTSITDPNGGVVSYTYTAAGRRSSVTDQVGDKTTMTYDNRGNLATVTSPRGNVPGANPADFTTTYTYDFNGNAVRTSHPFPGGGTVTADTRFDQLNRVTKSIDQLGRTTSRGYDNNSRIVSTVDPLGGTTTYTYDANGRPTAVTAPAGGSDATVYDAAGNVIKSTSAIGGVSTFTYDDDGRIATAVDPRGNASGANPADFTVRYSYDVASDVTAIKDQLGRTTSFAYDANNRVTAATDANGHATSYKYLDDDTQQSVIGPDGDTKDATTYTYDNAGNVVARTDAAGNSRFTYDKLGRITDVKDPLNRDTTLSYDPEGNLSQTVAPGSTPATSRTIAYTYDILNRMTKQDQGGGALVYTFGWDARNRLTSIADPTGTRTQSYDDLGRLSVVSRGDQRFTYGYDANGNVTSRTWPDGTTITATYAPDDRMQTLTAQGGQAGPNAAAYGFSYDPSGRLVQTTAPTANHLVTDRTYDQAGRLSDLDSHSDAGVVARYQVTRDAVGNPTGIATTRGTASQHVAYTYDVFDRLTAACIGADCTSPTGKIAYTYNENGDRLSQTLSGSSGSTKTTYQYDSAHELTGSSVTGPSGNTSTSYTYDPSGNLTQAGPVSFTYNLDHTLASATVNGSTTTYAHDGQGIQLSATNGSQSRTWQTDVNGGLPQLALESTTGGGTTTSRGFLIATDTTPLGLMTGGRVEPYAPDTVSGVADVLTAQGDPVAAFDFDPFGNPRSDGTAAGVTATSAPNAANPIGFAGGYQDSTLDNRYATPSRVYDPSLGRYNGLDPVSPAYRQPAVSPYAYVSNRPTSYRDPSGATPCPDAPGGDPDHNDAVELASWQLDARFGSWNVYAECPPTHRFLHGIPGPGRNGLYILPGSIPELIAGLPGLTYVWEVKKAADQVTPAVSPRGADAAAQLARYITALELVGLPNVQPGPDIAPSSQTNPDGSVLTIFSASSWSTYAPAGKRLAPGVSTSGIIYYNKTQPQRVPVPPSVPRQNPPNQGQNDQKEDPRDTPTTVPTDDPILSEHDQDVLVTVAVVAVVAIVVIALLPEELVVGAAAAVAAGFVALTSWAFSW
jgi:RHS repeat-associated protein